MSKRILTLSVLAFASAALVGACGSDDNSSSSSPGSALVAFSGSKCKKEAQSGQALTAEDAYAGLSCIRWEPLGEDALRITLVNFAGGCGAQWKGKVETPETGLELWATNPGCLLAACGSCIYDWTFDVKIARDADLPLKIVTDPCPGQQPPEEMSTTLPLSGGTTGELCRFADFNALGWQASALDTCGQAYMPCRTGNGMCSLGSARRSARPASPAGMAPAPPSRFASLLAAAIRIACRRAS